MGKEIKNDYQHLWKTATTIAGLCDLGDAFPVRNTTKLFLQQSEITVKGIRGLIWRDIFCIFICVCPCLEVMVTSGDPYWGMEDIQKNVLILPASAS